MKRNNRSNVANTTNTTNTHWLDEALEVQGLTIPEVPDFDEIAKPAKARKHRKAPMMARTPELQVAVDANKDQWFATMTIVKDGAVLAQFDAHRPSQMRVARAVRRAMFAFVKANGLSISVINSHLSLVLDGHEKNHIDFTATVE